MQKDLPGYNIALVKKRIRELQEKYEKEIKPNEKDYNEPNTRKDFILPILRVLNWYTETKDQVDEEFCIKNKRSFGSADYALKINGEVKLLLEAKSFDKDLETGYDIVNGQKRTYVEQLVGYAFDLNRHMKTKIDYCILTNGKEWRVYNVQWQGVAFDKKLVFVIKIGEFLTKFRKFWSLERGNVTKGDIDRFVMEGDKLPIDRKAVTSLLYCKKLLIDSIVKDYEGNKRDMKYMIDKLINKPVKDAPNGFPKFYEMPEDERLNKFVLESSSNVINKILFIRVIEDKGYLKPKLTKRSVEEWKSWFSQADRILRLFREACHEADVQYNGGIFDVNPYDTLNYDNDVLDKIIGILGNFNFEEIDADVIGRIYEIYLGTVLSVEEEVRGKKRTKLSADYTERKKLGQYYTPKFVVDFIVKNTLGKLLEGKTPEEISKIKVLDPACGSGSFLIRAFDYLKDYYVRYNDQQMSKIKKNDVGNMNNYIDNGIIIDYNHRILKENLHGVDLNALSTQICSINLWLRALEKDKKLEKLSKNILHGNSLISGVEDKEELAKYKAELKEIARLREKIKEYYGRELNKKEQDELEEMESKLKKLRNKTNSPINENLKKYFNNLDLVYPFNWEVEFTEVFDPDKPEEEQGFDVVIGNPPYGADLSKIKEYITDSYNSMYGKINSYRLFLEKGIDLLKEGGRLGFIIPNTYISDNDSLKIREIILTKTKIDSIIVLSESLKVFEDVVQGVSIIILEKCSNKNKIKNNYISMYDNIKNKNEMLDYFVGKVKQSELLNFKDYKIITDPKLLSLVRKLDSIPNRFDSEVIVNQGEVNLTVYKKHLRNEESNNTRILIRGNHIEKYYINSSTRERIGGFVDYRNLKRDDSSKERIILQEVSNMEQSRRVRVGYLDFPVNVGHTANYVYLKEGSSIKSIKYFMGLMNSKLIDFYFKIYSNTNHVSGKEIKNFPFVKPPKNIEIKITKYTDMINRIKNTSRKILLCFTRAINNQPIPHEKACKFAHYWDSSNFYDFSKETIPFANKTKAKILGMDIKEEDKKLIIYTTNISLVQNKKFENIKTIKLTIKNEMLRKFLYYSFKKYINEKKGRGFGSGIILEVIKKIPIPVYVINVEKNLDKIKKVMDDFEHETKELWKIDGKTYKSLTEIEEDIEKTDKKIDGMVYELYGISDEEKGVIEESLK